ncbi:hypothetical protein JIR23_21135 [Bradyrhizobium diazoefficiens]|nr:hypothetical protein [Bradyrhizobium diazoefficiens]QQN62106.1 hypothetical protein JIR23_21135 [Bradyrhizobium diazoefficiens]
MTRLATFQVCDEVAAVALGKLAFVGLYQNDMIVPSLPTVLPQLFFVVRFRTPVDDRPAKFAIRIERPGQDTFCLDHTNLLPQAPPTSEDARFIQVQAIARIAPFEITEAGIVRVYVEDEVGDNYAGGLRIQVGVHPQAALPQLAATANLVVGHYNRFEDADPQLKERLAFQLMETFSAGLKVEHIPVHLQFPELDMRLPLDEKRVKVFFPRPMIEANINIVVLPGGNFDSAEVESFDSLGFVAKFEPSAPTDAVFAFEVIEKPKASAVKQETSRGKKGTKS